MRVLISRTDVLGDAVVTSAFIQSLYSCFPGVILDVLCHHHNYPAFKYHPLVNKIYLLDHLHGTKALASNHRQLAEQVNGNGSYDIVLQLNGCIRSYKYLKLINSKVVYARKLLTKSIKSKLWMITNKLFGRFRFFEENVDQHEVIRLHQFLDFVLAATANTTAYNIPVYALFYPSTDYQWVKAAPNSVVINISGKKDSARYINDNLLYSLLSNLFANGYEKIDIVTLPEDEVRAIAVVSNLLLTNKVNLICNTNLYELAETIARYEYFIGADGGLVHIAAGLKLKCIVLFDKQNSNVWHAWSPTQISLQSENHNVYDISYHEVVASLRLL